MNGCLPLPDEGVVGLSEVVATDDPSPNAICNPFGNADSAGQGHGLTAKLWYAGGLPTSYTRVRDYQTHGTPVDATIYFDQLNVPTRAFDQGFTTQGGQTLFTPEGTTLYEDFALRFESTVRLGPNDEPGLYQFALLADDGAVLTVDDGTGERVLVDADGLHETMAGCAGEAIQLEEFGQLPIRVDYYQGPRYHIALMLAWRRVDGTPASFQDPACGVRSNTRYFDPVTGQAGPLWQGMVANGWRILEPSNYLLPRTAGPNPCVSPQN